MKRHLISLVIVLLAAFATSHAGAQQGDCGIVRDVKPKTLDEPTWKRLNNIYEMVGEENYQLAYEELVRFQKRTRGNNYLDAIIYQALAQVQWALEDYDGALVSFEEAVDLDALPDETHFSLMYQIAQLYYMKERYRDALARLDLWFCKAPTERIRADAYILKAALHAQIKEWQPVIAAVDTAIAMSDDPKENWYQLKLAANFEMQDFRAGAQTLEDIITNWPEKKMYWIQLSNVWFKLKQDDKALSVIALAHRKNLLDKQSDYLYLSNLYTFRDVPFKAAEALEEGLSKGIVEDSEQHWTIVADSWYAAEEREKALAAFAKAGARADDGEMDLRRGFILIDLERWEDARDALAMAIDKGGMNDRKTGEAYLMVGMSEFYLDRWSQAEAAWAEARQIDQTKKSAQQWINHLREERARKGP